MTDKVEGTAQPRIEHELLSHRGALGGDTVERLNALGAEGFTVCAAYALHDGTSTLPVHYYVLSRVVAQPAAEESKASAVPTPARKGEK